MAATKLIGRMQALLGLDATRFQKGLSESQKRLRDFGQQFRRVASVAAATGAAISAAALKGAQDIDQAAKAARRLDASIGAFEALKLAASEAGVSVSSLPNEIQNINRELANIGTSGNADRALERLGLSLDDLTGLDADEKLATISDAVKALGLSSGEATAVLRDLGVRNREVALLMIQGGDAVRRARRDVEDYGLALDSVEAGRIESANDSIGRLGLVTRYAGQQLALQLVPAMGRMADAMTASLREGGALRAMIDGLAGNIDRIITYIGTAVAAFGTRFVAALVAARIATFSLVGALAALRGALLRSGIGIAIVGIGELIYRFTGLIETTGSVGNAFETLGRIAELVWQGIVDSAKAIPAGLAGVWNLVRSDFITMVADLTQIWDSFIRKVTTGISFLTLGSVKPTGGGTGGLTEDLRAEAAALSAAAEENFKAMSGTVTQSMQNAGTGIKLTALGLGDLRTEFPKVKKEAENTTPSITDLGDALEDAGGSAGKAGSAGSAGIDKLKDSVKDASRATEDMGKKFGDLAADVITRTRSMSDVLQQFAKKMLSSGLGGLFNSLTGDPLTNALRGAGLNASGGGILSGLAGLIPGFANGVENFRGGLARINERGGELVNLPGGSTVIPHDLSARMVDQANRNEAHVTVGVDPETGNLQAFVDRRAGLITQQGLQQYDRTQLPQSLRRVSANNDERYG
ncbi:hypothetical protein [Paracoccus saliphilus]|uniref:Phage tail tape measure protein, TP901 family, core region n=1 Tax=Paracoccus saliphilus TaxID=405559 RepID=A0AA45W5Z9_9RHOB|nr:hypothetical protein [Paracoccus saliphilus]WCR01636.1 hypothetical protein JHX88_11900 [Paracoccus saliphilus]SIS98498.1 hypothetical protein SAMN05421772_11135 [Paracoccus saliphilus]